MRRFFSIFLIVCLLAALAACGGERAPAETPEQTAAPAETAVPAETAAPEEHGTPAESEGEDEAVPAFHLAEGHAAYPADATVMTVDGVEIPWSLYADLVEVAIYELNNYYSVTDLKQDAMDGMNFAQWIKTWAEGNFRSMCSLRRMAEEEGLSLTDEERAGVDAELTEQAETYFEGDVAALLEAMHLSEELYRYEAESTLLYDKLFKARFGERGEALPDADAVSWAEDQGYLYAKHILWLYKDENGEDLDDAGKAAKRVEVEAVLAELRAAAPEELEALFDAKMHALSADPGLASNPDGYYFTAGQMVAEFEEAARNLEVGQVSEPVESSYGLHLLYRPAMSGDHIAGSDDSSGSFTLRYMAASSLFSTMTEERAEQAELVYAPGFENLDLAELYHTETAG